ncbi:hypothetical protein [Streptomyces viridosporus]|uniref:hypothetical protein n=1 Tax=Streptomyces viridosporus TaxID=67581 RepID=UPI00331C4FFA
MDAAELDAWRRRHPNYTYWCGFELGGCGGKLTDRLYHDKVCHFAHVAGGPTCGRAATGESSADHLFIKRGLHKLLSKHKQRGTVETHDLGTGPGGAVDLYLPAARRRLRFQLARIDYRGWRAANLALADDVDEVDWLFGTDGPLTKELLARHGYSLRFRLETVGGERHVHIGSQHREELTLRWSPLEDCRITSTGLLMPSPETVRISPPRPKPLAFPIGGSVVFAFDLEASVPDDSPFATEGRRLVMADVKPVDSPIVRAVLSLPDDMELPPAQYVYRAPDHARILVHEESSGWAVHLDRFVRLNAMEAARTGLATAPAEQQETQPLATHPTRKPAEKVPSLPTRACATTNEGSAVIEPKNASPSVATEPARAEEKPAALTRNQAIVRARKLLREAAARRHTLDWSALASQLGSSYVNMTERDRMSFLVELDTPLRESKPVLSALLLEGSRLLPCMPAVLDRLGVLGARNTTPASAQLRNWMARERERAFSACATPARALPPRLDMVNAKATERRLTKKQTRQVESLISRTQERKIMWDSVKAPVSSAEERRKVREAIDRLEEKVAQQGTDFPVPKQVSRALHRSSLWLKYATPGAHIPEKPERQALRSTADGLLQSLAAAEKRLKGDTHRETLRKEVERLLAEVARAGKTIKADELESRRGHHDIGQRDLLMDIDRNATDDTPLLSSLVTDRDGAPLRYFRDILLVAGYKAPHTEEAMSVIWRREQERAHAAYANPPRALPERLVPRTGTPDQSAP